MSIVNYCIKPNSEYYVYISIVIIPNRVAKLSKFKMSYSVPIGEIFMKADSKKAGARHTYITGQYRYNLSLIFPFSRKNRRSNHNAENCLFRFVMGIVKPFSIKIYALGG